MLQNKLINPIIDWCLNIEPIASLFSPILYMQILLEMKNKPDAKYVCKQCHATVKNWYSHL